MSGYNAMDATRASSSPGLAAGGWSTKATEVIVLVGVKLVSVMERPATSGTSLWNRWPLLIASKVLIRDSRSRLPAA